MFAVVVVILLYVLLRGWRKAADGTKSLPSIGGLHQRALVLTLVVLALLVPLLGYGIVRLHGPKIEREAYANLEAVARLKAEQIENWLDERQGDCAALAASSGLAWQLSQLDRHEDAGLRETILARFHTLHTAYGYASILSLNGQGRLLVSLGEDTDIPPTLQNLTRQSLSDGKVQRSDLYYERSGHIHLDWVVPITVLEPDGERRLAIVLRATPKGFLFPLIQTWPTPSASAESLLLRRDGESAVYLNSLRFVGDAALPLRLPLADAKLFDAAIREVQPGTLQGTDYRGKQVLAAYRPVRGTDWHLVAKVDRDEVLAPVRELVFWVTLIAAFAVAAVSLAVLLLWRQQQRTHRFELAAQSLEVIKETQLNRELREALDAHALVSVTDVKGRILYANDKFCAVSGYTLQELLGQDHRIVNSGQH
ncbi:MAG: multi-sensor signal transduction histidine kinase, partial [Proteobacteria bacterium]|nr:multi-sensor signal transduction histidine kinase [Pseudomonadota bacterium]